MGSRDVGRRLVGWALEEGFDRAGVAVLGPAESADALRAWLERGDHAGLAWMERRSRERSDPRLLLEGARSALCVALQYHPVADREPAPGDLWEGVARYARGEDYHLVMEEGLARLAGRVETAFPGARWRAYVDTGPVLERELAARAGLGAIGKNTNLLHPEAGSWFLLGELLLTLEVDPEPAFEDLCGRCTACLDACPTGALPAPYRLDSRRCISYWTIEHRGAIPEAVRPLLGRWVFGCDVCQEVCPANQTAAAATEPRLRLPPGRAELDLPALAALSRDEYQERLRRSPLKRTRLEGLKRNAAIVMGNRAEARYVPVLARLVRADEHAVVRSHAAWALGRIGGESARRALEAASAGEPDRAVRAEIDAALSAVGAGSARP
jgi:epoxyqueuosine reductase